MTRKVTFTLQIYLPGGLEQLKEIKEEAAKRGVSVSEMMLQAFHKFKAEN